MKITGLCSSWKRLLGVSGLFVPSLAFAAAGIADRYADHQRWILPAYKYCFVFGLVIFFGLFAVSRVYKTKTREITGRVSAYLIRHRIKAIIVTGILLAIPLGIVIAASWEVIWVLSIFPAIGAMFALPLLLANRQFREKCLLSPFAIKYAFMTAITAVAASLLFVFLANNGILPGTDITYSAHADRLHPTSYIATHPYDSMKEIWGLPLIFIAEIPIAIILCWLGVFSRYIRGKIHSIRHMKQQAVNDVHRSE